VEVTLLTNGVSWYLRSFLAVDGVRISVTTPRIVLGLVSIGSRRFVVNLRDLRHISIATKLNPDRFAVAVGLGLASAFGGFGLIFGILFGVGAVAMLLLSFIAVVRIEERNEKARTVPVCLAHLPRARRFLADVELRSVTAHQNAAGGVG
jgi:hypothetical protein